MSDATPTRLGVQNATTDGSFAQDNALFLKVFAGEVMTAFAINNIMMPLHKVRSIQHGKSAQFPATWRASAQYHTPGHELLGDSIIHMNERVINIDDMLVADTFIADIDEAKNHFDVRQAFSQELGRALAVAADKRLLQTACLAARASGTIDTSPAGTALTNAAYATTGATLASGIAAAAQTLDENNVSDMDRHVALLPAQYWLLAQTTGLMNRDWGGNGDLSEGKIEVVSGVQVHKTNNLPKTNIASPITGEQNTYNGDFSNTVGVVWHSDAIGTVKLLDLSLKTQYQIQRLGTLFVAGYAMGHGILRPECSVELKKA